MEKNKNSEVPANNESIVPKYASLVEGHKTKFSGFDPSKYESLFTPTPINKFDRLDFIQSLPTILDSDPNLTLDPNMYTDQPRSDWATDAINSIGKAFNQTQMSSNFYSKMEAQNTINLASKQLESLQEELKVSPNNQELHTQINDLKSQVLEGEKLKLKAEEEYNENQEELNSYYVSPSYQLKEAIVQAKGGDSDFWESMAYTFPTGLGSTLSLMGPNIAATFGTQLAKQALVSLVGIVIPEPSTTVAGVIGLGSSIIAIGASLGTIGLARKWETEAEVGGFLEQIEQQQIEQWKLRNPGQEPSSEVIRDFQIEAYKQGEKLFQEQMMLAIPDAVLALAMPMSKLTKTITGVPKFNKGLSNAINYNRATRTGKEISKVYFQYLGEKFEEGFQYVANERATDLTLGLNKFEDRDFITSVLIDATDVLGSISYGPYGTLRPDGKFADDKEFQFSEGLGGLMGVMMGGVGGGLSIIKDLNTYKNTVKDLKAAGVADTENKINRFRGEVLFKAFENETLPHYLEAMRTLTKTKDEKGNSFLSETQLKKETEFAKEAFDKYFQVNKYVKDVFPQGKLGFAYTKEQKTKLATLKKELFLTSLNLTEHKETFSKFESLQNIDLAIQKQKNIIKAIENTKDNSILEKTYNIQERLKIANEKLKELETRKINEVNELSSSKEKITSMEEANLIQEVLTQILNLEQLQNDYSKLLKVKDNVSLDNWYSEKIANEETLTSELNSEAAETNKKAAADFVTETSNEAEIEGALTVEQKLNEEVKKEIQSKKTPTKSTPVSKKVDDLADKSISKPLNVDNNKAVEQVRERWNNNKANAPKDIKDINSRLKETGLMPIHKSAGIKKTNDTISAISLEMAMTNPEYSKEAEVIRQYYSELTPSKYKTKKQETVTNPIEDAVEKTEDISNIGKKQIEGTTTELLDRELNNSTKRTRIWQWVHSTLKKVEQFINRPDFNPEIGSKVRYVIHRDQDSVQKLLNGDPAITTDNVAIYIEVQQGEEWIPIGEVPFRTKEQEYSESELARFRATVWNKFLESETKPNVDTKAIEQIEADREIALKKNEDEWSKRALSAQEDGVDIFQPESFEEQQEWKEFGTPVERSIKEIHAKYDALRDAELAKQKAEAKPNIDTKAVEKIENNRKEAYEQVENFGIKGSGHKTKKDAIAYIDKIYDAELKALGEQTTSQESSTPNTFILEQQGNFKGRALARMFHLQPTEENPNTFVNVDEVTSKYGQETKFLIWSGTFEDPETHKLNGTDALTQEELDYANRLKFSQPGTVYFLLPYGNSFTSIGAYVQKLNSNERILTEVQDLIAKLLETKPTTEENAMTNEVVAQIQSIVARPFYYGKNGIRLIEGSNEDSANNVFKDYFNRDLTLEEFSSIIGEALFNVDKEKINFDNYNTKLQEEGKIKTNINPEQPFFASSFRFTFPDISYQIDQVEADNFTTETVEDLFGDNEVIDSFTVELETEKVTTEDSKLKQGVAKLFENNPTLANSVYEAMGLNTINESDITYTEEVTDSKGKVVVDKEGNPILKPCKPKGGIKAADGLTNATKGTSWKIVKDFKGMPKHSQGGVDISISDKGVSMRRGGKDIKAAHGLLIPATIMAQDGLVVDGGDDDILPTWDKVKATLNPYNWGVTDYTDKYDTWDKAYAAAKKAGEKEIMWNKGKNPGRKNLDYAGTPRQEVGAYGVDGKPVHPMDLNHPSQVNLYPAFGQYLPGHIEASIGDNETSVDYSAEGNYPYSIGNVKNEGEKSFNVYGQDNLTFSNKVASLPTGYYMLEDKYTPSDWNIFTNNCADNVCDAFGIPRSKGVETPANTLNKIKNKYPTLEVTGRTYEDYNQLSNSLLKETSVSNVNNNWKEYTLNKKADDILNQSKNLIGIASSPDLQKTKVSKNIIIALQKSLQEKEYKLPKSTTKEGTFDGVYGEETKQALLDYQSKNKNK